MINSDSVPNERQATPESTNQPLPLARSSSVPNAPNSIPIMSNFINGLPHQSTSAPTTPDTTPILFAFDYHRDHPTRRPILSDTHGTPPGSDMTRSPEQLIRYREAQLSLFHQDPPARPHFPSDSDSENRSCLDISIH